MREEEKIRLAEVCERLQKQMEYEDPWHAMEVLLYGWCKNRRHSANWLSDMKRRGWMSRDMARDFAQYCGYMFV